METRYFQKVVGGEESLPDGYPVGGYARRMPLVLI
jgi:hypothetical protein